MMCNLKYFNQKTVELQPSKNTSVVRKRAILNIQRQ